MSSRSAFSLGAAFPVLLTACGDATGPERLELAINRARWAARGPAAYTYEYRLTGCECLPQSLQPVHVTVDNGEVTSVVWAATGEPVPPPGLRITIDSLFATLAGALRQDAHRVDATYDPRLGYPTSGFIDYDVMVADEEYGFSARLLGEPSPAP